MRVTCALWAIALAAGCASAARTKEEVQAERRALQARLASVETELKGLKDCVCTNGFYEMDVETCQCFSCYSGPACDILDETCAIDDGQGNPLLHAEYWKRNAYPEKIKNDLGYRVGYQFGLTAIHGDAPVQGSLLPALNKSISELHAHVGNVADLDKKNLVIGNGCTELIDAAIYACKVQYGTPGKKMYVYAKSPHYNGYQAASILQIPAGELEFVTDKTGLDPKDVIEFVTYPNNPTNDARQSEFNNSAACTIYDSVYFWPSLWGDVPLPPAKPTVQTFSMSKLSGHAGTRFGWGLTEEAEIANLMAKYITASSRGPSADGQLKVLSVLDHLLENDAATADDFFGFIKSQLASRWMTIQGLIGEGSAQTRFAQRAAPHGFYAWVQCLQPEDAKDCNAVFANAGIKGTPGPAFGGGPDFVRLQLVQAQSQFNILVDRITQLIA